MKKTIQGCGFLLFSIVVVVIVFAVFPNEDIDDRISFSLVGNKGQSVEHTDFSGRWLLVSFGFTSCPNACPTQTAEVTQTMRILDEKHLSNQVVPVFISVDYLRDTPKTVETYLNAFDKRFIGLTGTEAQLDLTVDAFNAFYEVTKDPNAHHGGIDVVHSNMVFLVDPSGRIKEQFLLGFKPNFLAGKIESFL